MSTGISKSFLASSRPALNVVLGGGVMALLVSGCGQAEDRDIEAKLSTVAAHRSDHPHYPIMVFGDYGNDSQPGGISVDVFGPYVHVSTKPNPELRVLSQVQATEKIERVFEKAIQSAQTEEAATPAPKPPLPSTPEWKTAPHPAAGTYRIVSRFGSSPHAFDVALAAKADPATIRTSLQKDAETIVSDGIKVQNQALEAVSTPSGFSLCTDELLKIQQGSRGVEPHLMGGPLLLTPLNKDQALKGLDRSIRKLLDSTAKLKPAPSVAHLLVDGPGFSETYPIPVDNPKTQEDAIKTALSSLGSRIDQLNKN